MGLVGGVAKLFLLRIIAPDIRIRRLEILNLCTSISNYKVINWSQLLPVTTTTAISKSTVRNLFKKVLEKNEVLQ